MDWNLDNGRSIWPQLAQQLARRRYYYKKARVVLKSKLHLG